MEKTIRFSDAIIKLDEFLSEEMKLSPPEQFQLCLTFAIGLINHKEFYSREELLEFLKEKAFYYYDKDKFNALKQIHSDKYGDTIQ